MTWILLLSLQPKITAVQDMAKISSWMKKTPDLVRSSQSFGDEVSSFWISPIRRNVSNPAQFVFLFLSFFMDFAPLRLKKPSHEHSGR
jgi:hypothetical protein